MTRVRHLAVAAAVFALAVVACSSTSGAPSAPSACEAVFSPVRCSIMTDYAAARLNTPPGEILAISVLPPPTPEVRDGQTILHVTSGGPNVLTLVTLHDGSVHEVSMNCVGIPELQCKDDPQLRATSVTMAGYFDTPEGATPVPTPGLEAIVAARPLRVPRLDIPIDNDGHSKCLSARPRCPTACLSAADFQFVSRAWPSDVAIAGCRRRDAGRPVARRPDSPLREHPRPRARRGHGERGGGPRLRRPAPPPRSRPLGPRSRRPVGVAPTRVRPSAAAPRPAAHPVPGRLATALSSPPSSRAR